MNLNVHNDTLALMIEIIEHDNPAAVAVRPLPKTLGHPVRSCPHPALLVSLLRELHALRLAHPPNNDDETP